MTIINTLNHIDINNITDYWNLEDLNKLYFVPKKITKDLIHEKMNNDSYLEKIKNTFDFISKFNIEKIIKEIFVSFENDTDYKLNKEKLFIIIGLDTTTIYSTCLENEDITVLCLESIKGDMSNLKMLLAHEFTHFIRKNILRKDIFEECIGERIITEGIASNDSREIVPNKKDYEYCIVPNTTIEWVKNNVCVIENIINENLSNNKFMYLLFYMYAKIDIKDMPVRCGYVYGYLKVQEYLKNKNLKIKDILGMNWKEILKRK